MPGKHSKRTLTPEQIAKMQEGRAKAKRHREIVADANRLENRMRKAAYESEKPVRITGRRRHKHVSHK